MLFYGQEHFDTISILDDKRDISKDNIGQFMKQQRILSNRELMLKNFSKLIESLTECELYIQKVIDGNITGDADIGRMLNKCMGQFTKDDMQVLEQMVKTNFKDAVMASSLAKLQMAQIHLTEKINTVFSQSLNQYILH